MLCDKLEGWELGGRFRREETCVYICVPMADSC